MATLVKDDSLQFQKAREVFVTKRRAVPGQRKSEDDDKTIYDTEKAGQGALNELEQELSPEHQKIASEQRKNMLDLMGVGSSWLRWQAEEQGNPGIVFDPKYLMEMYSSLPLLAYTGAKKQAYSQKIRSVEISASFLSQLIGFTVAAGTGLADFRTFLTDLQGGIKAGVTITDKPYSTFTTAMVYVMDQATKDLEIRLDGYMVNFNASSTIVKTNCASVEVVDIEFQYQYVRAPFLYHKLDNPETKKLWDDFINDADKDDLERAKNKFKKKSIEPKL
ncbi:MAG TPA: hypothetical protein VM677_21635 [Actinokineospora sp.]|jgi:hypothetical protein|nr:hypothetical protein [Actinokineospora sp.]